MNNNLFTNLKKGDNVSINSSSSKPILGKIEEIQVIYINNNMKKY